MSRRKKLLIVGALLYAVTWVGGWRAHAREVAEEAKRRYGQAVAQNNKIAGGPSIDAGLEIELSVDGPRSGVDWCVPLLPGVLLADSYYVVGPLYGEGQTKLVLYYGFGSWTLFELWGWKA